MTFSKLDRGLKMNIDLVAIFPKEATIEELGIVCKKMESRYRNVLK